MSWVTCVKAKTTTIEEELERGDPLLALGPLSVHP